MNLDTLIHIVEVLALVVTIVYVLLGAIDLTRECWAPEQVDIPPGYRILPRQPYDYKQETS